MVPSSFFSLSLKEKKKALKSIVRGANEDQRKLMRQYEALKKSKKRTLV